MKKIVKFLLTVCLIIPAVVIMPACADGDAQALAEVSGTYSNYVISNDCKTDATLKIEKDGSFKYTSQDIYGIETSTISLTGKIAVDANKKVVSCEFDDILKAASSVETVLGNVLPQQDNLYGSSGYLELALLQNYLGDIIKDGIRFNKDYVILSLSSYSCAILYKEGAQRYAANTVVGFFTKKDAYDLRRAMNDLNGYFTPNYKTDYYFVKNEYDLTKAEQKQLLMEYFNNYSNVIITNADGSCDYEEVEITDVSGFNFSTVGEKTGTVKYFDGKKDVEKSVTYTIVEKTDDLPENQIATCKIVDGSNSEFSVKYVEKGTEIYTLDWRYKYKTFSSGSSSSSYSTILINQDNCTGANKTITVSGYDKNKTGYQVVSFEYNDKACQQAIYVYDETNNPVTSITAADTASVIINKATDGTCTIDLSNAKIKLMHANGDEVMANLTSAQTFNLLELNTYATGDYISFAYKYQFANKTYTFYLNVYVEVVEN